MRLLTFIQNGYGRFLEAQQVRMSNNYEGLPLLALLGLVCGLLSGGVIILFRLAMDGTAQHLLPLGSIEGFEELTSLERFLLCAGGGLLVGLILQALKPKHRSVGVVHVIERLDYHQGRLPFKNAIVQFVAGLLSLMSGHSVGREGPSIHLGATSGSILGRQLRVPNNSVRILIACGVAAAIAAAFNTPLAGVIFAMEVVIMDYSVIGFTPVIIAAVSATTLTRIIFGDSTVFSIPITEVNSLHILPIVAIMGGLIGCLSAAFIQATVFISSVFQNKAIYLRTLLAGIVTGGIAIVLPQVMGAGYDTVDLLLLTQIGLSTAILLVFAKTLTTAAAVGLGIPAGLIGPILFIGAAAGSVVGLVAANLLPATNADAGYFALLGMAAMMAATLQAPLAALIYLLELSASQSIILPGMTAVITASLVAQVVFKKSSIYRHLMLVRGLDYRNSGLSKALRRIGVASVMDRNIIQQQREISQDDARSLLEQEPRWILLIDEQDQRKTSLLPATDLARHLSELETKVTPHKDTNEVLPNNLDLMSIPAKRLSASSTTIIATLQEAYEKLQSEQCDVLYITGAHGNSRKRIYGVITREHIESSCRV